MFGWIRRKFDDGLWTAVFGRSGAWARVRREHLLREPACVACGRDKDLHVHHVVPFHQKPELELSPGNLCTLCHEPCHFVFGHLLNWSKCNPHVREDAKRYRERMQEFGVVAEVRSLDAHPE